MFPIRDLVPTYKFDYEVLGKLRKLDLNKIDINPIIPELFEWIQNINWPIAPDLCKILATFRANDIIPQIKLVLNSGDDCWQNSCLCYLIPELPIEVKRELLPDLLRIATSPTEIEKYCEFDSYAKKMIDSLS
ncbi:DUF5071 domain-containing protein [Paenibacillus albus]|uniref:DUF5071 domain-containing protein n=1 Tax=Paenibacillus albus TaxID=2495582 RepID=A0A3Q8X8C8_9BACL|nr:DUF5071 domain-containing protein [Paenibacillus albus]AZN41649.1 DUF5071 domain-containing protein [Paenibacillus albus]